MQMLRKISRDTVFGTKGDVLELCFKDKTKAHPLYRVIGICNGSKAGTGGRPGAPTDRTWTALIGQFEATNLVTGEVFRSGTCHLPDYLVNTVIGQLTPDTEAVHFGFDIAARYDEPSATSYVYEATPLIEPRETDPLARLAHTIHTREIMTTSKGLEQQTLPKPLTGPETEQETVEETEPKKAKK